MAILDPPAKKFPKLDNVVAIMREAETKIIFFDGSHARRMTTFISSIKGSMRNFGARMMNISKTRES